MSQQEALDLFSRLCGSPVEQWVVPLRQARPSVAELARQLLEADRTGLTEGFERAVLERLEVPRQLGDFLLGAPLDAGGMGQVFEATQLRLGRATVVKVLHPWLLDRRGRGLFRREASALAGLSHPAIPRVLAGGQEGALVWLAMERVPGGRPASLDWSTYLQVVRAVAYAHRQGVLHLDLKPSNLMVDEDGTAFILDFGLASAAGSAALRAGTEGWEAPEQRSSPPSPRMDVYALGRLAQVLVPKGEAAAGVQAALALDPSERPEDASALLDALGESPVRLPRRASSPAAQRLTLELAELEEASDRGALRALAHRLDQGVPGLSLREEARLRGQAQRLWERAGLTELQESQARRCLSASTHGADTRSAAQAHLVLAELMGVYGDSVSALEHQVVAERLAERGSPEEARLLRVWAAQEMQRRRMKEAERLLRRAIALGFEDAMCNLGRCLAFQKRHAEADEVLSEALEQVEPGAHHQRAVVLLAMAQARHWAKDFEGALLHLEAAIGLREPGGGAESPRELALLLRWYASTLLRLDRPAEALEAARRGLEYAAGGPYVASLLRQLGACLARVGDWEGAREIAQQAVDHHAQVGGLPAMEIEALRTLCEVLVELGELGEARRAHQRALALMEEVSEPSDSNTRKAFSLLEARISRESPPR